MASDDRDDEYDVNEGIPDKISWMYAAPRSGFDGGHLGDGRPFWSALEGLAWMASGNHAFTRHIGKIHRDELGLGVHLKAALGQLLLITSKQFCRCNSQDMSNDVVEYDGEYEFIGPETFWRDCSCMGKASRSLFAAIESGQVTPIDPERRSKMAIETFAPLDLRDSGADWLFLDPQPVFLSTEVMKTSAAEEASGHSEATLGPTQRAPAFKRGHPPTDSDILAKADEMRANGVVGRTLASAMRFEKGFENVGTVHVRKLIEGRYPRTGRPKKRAE